MKTTRSRLTTGLLLSALALTVVSVSAGGGGLGPMLAHRGITVAHLAGGPSSTEQVPGAAAAGTALATFGQATISGIQGNGFEQDIRVDSKDRVYTSVPGALSSGTSWIWRSLDHGKTFKWVPAAEPKSGKLPTCVGGGDTELAVDSADHLYFNDLTLANFSTGRSDDQGRTFTPPNCIAVDTTPDDRQWYATDGDPTTGIGSLYLTYDIVGFGPPECSGSIGNNTVVMARSPAGGVGPDAGVHFSPAQFVSDPTACDEGIMGNNEVSPATHKVFVIHDNAAFDAILIGRCRPVPYTDDPSGLKCVDSPWRRSPASGPAGTSPRWPSTGRGTSSRCGSRLRSTPEATSPVTPSCTSRPPPTRETTGRPPCRSPRPACTTTSSPGRRRATPGEWPSRGTGRGRQIPPVGAPDPTA
jgi:hypothetical protein